MVEQSVTEMYVGRSTVIPIILGVVVSLLILSYASYGAAMCEFGSAVGTRDKNPLPAIAACFKQAYPFYWIMPSLFAIWGVLLLLRRTTSAALAWYVSSAAVVGMFWLCFALLSFYLCNQTFWCGHFEASR
jgi:hypothetical protein